MSMEDWQKSHVKKYLGELVKATKCSDELIEKLRLNLALSPADAWELSRLRQPERSKRLYEILLSRLGLFEILQNSFKETGEEGALRILQDVESEDCVNVGSISFDRRRIRGVGKLGLASKIFMGKFGSGRLDVAVKELNTTYIDDEAVTRENVEALIKLELHENVARFYGYECQDNWIYIASDFALITLQDEVKLNLVKMDNVRVLNGCTEGLGHLHNKLKILHKNLKPSNVLLCHGDKVKITDFGLPKGNSRFAIVDGAGDWMPPEILKRLTGIEEIVDGNEVEKMFTKESDIFALGCIYYFTLTNGHHPFGEGYSRQHNIINYNPNLVNPNVDDDLKMLISAMIAENPLERLSVVVDILVHLNVITLPPYPIVSTNITQPQPTSSHQIPHRLLIRPNRKNVSVSDNNLPTVNTVTPSGHKSKPRKKTIPSIRSRRATKRKRCFKKVQIQSKKMPRISAYSEVNLRINSVRSLSTSSDGDPTFELATESQPGIIHHEDATTESQPQEPRAGPSSPVDQEQEVLSPGLFVAEQENNKLPRQEVASVFGLKSEKIAGANISSGENLRQETQQRLSFSWDQTLECYQAGESESSPRHSPDILIKIEQPELKPYSSPTSQQMVGSSQADNNQTGVLTDSMSKTNMSIEECQKNEEWSRSPSLSSALPINPILECKSEAQNGTDGSAINLIRQAIIGERPVAYIRGLVKLGVDWKAKTANGSTALHEAAAAGHVDAFKYLFTLEGARDMLEEKDIDGLTPLLYAAYAKKNFIKIVNVLIKSGADKSAVNNAGNNLLFLAVFNRKSKPQLRNLVRSVKVRWINVCNKLTEGILHLAAQGGNLQALKYFISLKADVNDTDGYGQTPLHASASSHNTHFFETIDLLVDQGGDLKAVDDEGNNLLLLAAVCGRSLAELERLKSLGFSWEIRNHSGESLLHKSVEGGNVEAVKYLISNPSLGFMPNDKDISGKTALLKVASARRNISELLIALQEADAEFEVNAKDNDGNNLILLGAVEEGRSKDDLEIMINDFGVDWQLRNFHGQGVIHMAAKGGNAEAIEYFVSLGADVNAKDKVKGRPLLLVLKAEEGFAKTLACLIRNGAKIEKDENGTLKEKLIKRIDKEKKAGLLNHQQVLELELLVNNCVVK